MPNKPCCSTFLCASLHLTAHLVVLSIEFFVYSYVDGYGQHSSKDIIISAPKSSSICITFSGVNMCLLPSKWDLNSTPSSDIVLNSLKLKTWKPPQSVNIGLSQFINLCRPPASLTIFSPGLKYKWYVFDNIIWAPKPFTSSGVIDLTVACVPTGMNTGVWISPCGVWTTPLLAPEFLSSCNSSYVIACFILYINSPLFYKHCISETKKFVFFFYSFIICIQNILSAC